MKLLLGIILTIGFIKQVYPQSICSRPSCLYDQVCLDNITSYCECNPTLYDNPDYSTLLLTTPLSCSPGQFLLDITGCLGRNMNMDGFYLPDDDSQNVPCFYTTTPSTPGVATYSFNFSSTNPNCAVIVLVNDTYVTYSTNVLYPYNATDGIILYNDIQVTYNCSFPLDMISSLGLAVNPVLSTKNITITGTGTYTTTMALYKNSDYTGPYTVADMPIVMTVEQPLYIGAFVTGVDATKFSLKVVSCYATPTNSSSDSTKYYIIDNSCPMPGTSGVTFVEDGISLRTRFSIKLFKFVNKPQVYLYCSFSLCNVTCPVSCGTRATEIDNGVVINMTAVGPFVTKDDVSSDTPNSSDSLVFPWAWKVSCLLALLLLKVM